MTHKADSSFFDRKRVWSERKDLVLKHYLTPYLPKIATQRKLVLIVDGFAGPGVFLDGKPGSPTIIESVVDAAKTRKLSVPIKCLYIEPEKSLFDCLKRRFSMTGYVDCINSCFSDAIPRIESLAQDASTFLYLDPYTVEGLEWDSLGRIFRFLEDRKSVEILLNFNASSFVRRGLAALSLSRMSVPEESDEDWVDTTAPAAEALDQVVGGDWWRGALQSSPSHAESVLRITTGFCQRLRSVFNEVCSHDIRENWEDSVPKYTLIFGSRHPHGLLLMNEAMGRARENFAVSSVKKQPLLIETRPTELVPESSGLLELLVELSATPTQRRDLVTKAIRAHFCRYREAQIHHAIAALVQAGRLCCAGGLSDSAVLRRP